MNKYVVNKVNVRQKGKFKEEDRRFKANNSYLDDRTLVIVKKIESISNIQHSTHRVA